MTQDRIRIEGLRAHAFHGLLEQERREGQLFVIDVTVWLPLAPAAAADELAATIHYGELAEQIVAAVERDPVDLIETVAERVAALVLAHPAAERTEVTVHKPNAPVQPAFRDISVTVVRER